MRSIIRCGIVAAGVAITFLSHGFAPTLHAQQATLVANPDLAAKGVWDAGTTYAKDDIVVARGSSWRSLHNNNLNNLPGQTQPSTAAWWQLFARGFNPTGAWSNVIKYQPDDLVIQNGQTYRAKLTNTNKQTANTTYWELLAAKGAPGPNTGVGAGSQSAPAISFAGDGDTGIYRPGANKIALVEGGELFLHSIGTNNTALGVQALKTHSGTDNTAVGTAALANNTNGGANTAMGSSALFQNTTGQQNTALGSVALLHNTVGGANTAVGAGALSANTDGINNTAVGGSALTTNTSGQSNTAVGFQALNHNTGDSNTAFGTDALLSSSTGNSNTAIGFESLTTNTTGGLNTAVGHTSLANMGSGQRNTAVGSQSLSGISSGNDNIAIGYAAAFSLDTTASNAIFIGNTGVSGDTNLIKIGTSQAKTFIAGIRGKTTDLNDAVAVLIDSAGQLGTASSSRRYKYDIETMADVSAMLAKLRPVTFRYKEAQSNGEHPLQYGLIAEEVADVFPNLAVFKDGEPQTVKYHLLPSFLLAGWQAQQSTIAAQAANIDALLAEARRQKEINTALEARLARLEAALPQTKAAALR